MEAIRVQSTVERDGEIRLTNLPCTKGQSVELIVLLETSKPHKRARLTGNQLLESGLVGLWKDRDDIKDSSVYARELRDKAQRRRT